MMLQVQYQNYRYDFVDVRTLDRLLAGKGIRRFRRPSGERWVNVHHDPIRGMGGNYSGPDRRQHHETNG
jgi:hypothetical protein